MWLEILEEDKFELIEDGEWVSGRKLCKFGKEYILRLCIEVLGKVNNMVGPTGQSVVREAMIQAGISLDINGHWHVEKLCSELQIIVQKYSENFQGIVAVPPDQQQ